LSRGFRLAALAALLYVAGVAVWIRYDRRSAQEVFDPGSVFNSGEEGLSLAFAYLRERSGQGTVTTLHGRVEPAGLPAGGVVLRIEPSHEPFLSRAEEEEDEKDGKDGKDEAKERAKKPADRAREKKQEEESARASLRFLTPAEEAWVREGGRLVIAFDDLYGPAFNEELRGRQPVRKVFPIWPGVSRLVPPVVRGMKVPRLAGLHAVFLAGDSALALRQALGAGELILLATPEVLENRHLGQAHHLAFLEALAGLPERRPVLFDERSHGLADSNGVLKTLAGWGLGPLLLLGLVTTGAAFWRASARLGPPEREDRDGRSDAVELLDSLADLYDRALDRGDAVRLYHESFLHTLAVETGLRGSALDERAQAYLDGWAPAPGEDLSRERFEQALRTINQAFRRVSHAKRNAKR
jgi:hypothetical protein